MPQDKGADGADAGYFDWLGHLTERIYSYTIIPGYNDTKIQRYTGGDMDDETVVVRIPAWLRDALKIEAVNRKTKTLGDLIVTACVTAYEDVERISKQQQQ